MGIQEYDLVPGGESDDVALPAELQSPDGICCGVAPDLCPVGGVPDPHSLVVAAAEELLVVRAVHDLLDAARVSLQLDDGLTRLLQVEYPEHLVVAAGGEGSAVVAEVDALDDVFVLESELLLPRQSIPHLGGEVRGPRGGLAGVLVDVHPPDGAFVTLECSNPVPGVPSSQHWLPCNCTFECEAWTFK